MTNSPDPALQTTLAGRSAAVSPQPGMQLPAFAPADPTGRITCGAQVLLAMGSAAYGTASSPQLFSTMYITYAALDMTLTSVAGGTAPTVNFFLERQGADSNWYQILSTSAQSTAQTVSVDISPGLNGVVQGPLSSTVQHNVFTQAARLRWVFGGGATAATFTASVIGR